MQKDEMYKQVTKDERLLLWEQGVCPGKKVCCSYVTAYEVYPYIVQCITRCEHGMWHHNKKLCQALYFQLTTNLSCL